MLSVPGPLEETASDRANAAAGSRRSTVLWGVGVLVVGVVFSSLMAYVPVRYEYVATSGVVTDAGSG